MGVRSGTPAQLTKKQGFRFGAECGWVCGAGLLSRQSTSPGSTGAWQLLHLALGLKGGIGMQGEGLNAVGGLKRKGNGLLLNRPPTFLTPPSPSLSHTGSLAHGHTGHGLCQGAAGVGGGRVRVRA